jgi:hypothetical protein
MGNVEREKDEKMYIYPKTRFTSDYNLLMDNEFWLWDIAKRICGEKR